VRITLEGEEHYRDALARGRAHHRRRMDQHRPAAAPRAP
jgi:hypothetical protein